MADEWITWRLFPDDTDRKKKDLAEHDGSKVRTLQFNARSLFGNETWHAQQAYVADFIHFTSRCHDLRVIRLHLKDASCVDFGIANAIVQTFLSNTCIPSSDKEIFASVVIKDGVAMEIGSFLQAISPAVTELILFDQTQVDLDKDDSEILMTAVGSMGRLKTLSIHASFWPRRERFVGDYLLRTLANIQTSGTIQTLHWYSGYNCNSLAQLSGFLSSRNSSSLENLDLWVNGEDFHVTLELVHALCRRSSLKNVLIQFRNELPPVEASRLLARYFSKTKLECLRVDFGIYFDHVRSGFNENVDSLGVLLSGIASDPSIAKLDLALNGSDLFFRQVAKTFFERCQMGSLLVRLPPGETHFWVLADGLRDYPWVHV